MCSNTPPTYSSDCTDYNNYKAACNGDTSSGINSTGCVYDESNNTCGDRNAACSTYTGRKSDCLAVGSLICRWKADDNTCIDASSVPSFTSSCGSLYGFR